MNKKLYVGNLSYDVTEADLEDLFKKAGTVVSVTIITDRYSGKSKGFGFVEMDSEEGAKTAIKTLNGQTLKDRAINVNEARPPRPREERSGFQKRQF